jgi:hypothetical protein
MDFRKKEDGLYVTKIHGHPTYFKVIESEPHVLNREGGKLVWSPTIMEPQRFVKLKPISIEEIIELNVEMRRKQLVEE